MQTMIKVLNVIFGVLIVVVLCLIGARMYNPAILGGYSDWNGPPAIVATILLLLTLLPGTLQRLQVPMRFLKYPIVFRRTIGIAMYLSALIHFLFLLDYLPWFSEGLIQNVDALTASGLAALLVLSPALLTSNNISVRFLGRWWKVIQRVTYLILPFVAVHLWNTDQKILAGAYGVMTFLILLSYFIKLLMRSAAPFLTAMIALAVIVLAIGLTAGTLWFFVRNPADARRDADLSVAQARTEELEEEKTTLQQKVIDLEGVLAQEREKIAEIEARAAQEKAAADEEARKKQEEEKAAAAAKAEVERIAALTDYNGGTYTGIGKYSTDKGDKSERIDVKLSISDDIVTNVEIISHAKASKSQKYVGKFTNDIAGIVIGKKVDTLDVHGIGGASDTSTGFRTALESIKGQARR